MKQTLLVSLAALTSITHLLATDKENPMQTRKPTHPVNKIFNERWSPYAMSGESIRDQELMTLFEAARWAPSSYNNQSWRFIYAKRNTPAWNTLFDLVVDLNQVWAKNAAVLVVVISSDILAFNGQPSRTHSFDAGAAWENLALQGSLNGLVIHGMEGFDYDKAKEVLNIPDGYTVEAMIAIGKPGKKKDLPAHLQERERLSERKALNEIVFEGTFKP